MTTKNERNQKYKQAAAAWALHWFQVTIDLNKSINEIWEETIDLYNSAMGNAQALDSSNPQTPPPPPPPH